MSNICLDSGRLTEALTLADHAAEYTPQAGYGPWNQLANQIQRLKPLVNMGRTRQVLFEVRQLQEHMRGLPVRHDAKENTDPWSVREVLLGIGQVAAIRLDRWQEALDLGDEIAASKHGRDATAAAIAGTRFNDYGPLLRLGRTDEALALLMECRRIFHDTRDIHMLGKIAQARELAGDGTGRSAE